jgi:hypothetical protein
MGTRGYFPGGKAAGAWSWPLTPIYCRGPWSCASSPATRLPGRMAVHIFVLAVLYRWKVKLSLCFTGSHAMTTTIWRSMVDGCVTARILNLGTGQRWVVNFTLRPLYPQRRISCTHWIGGWVGPRVGLYVVAKRKKIPSLFLPGVEPRSSNP